MFNPGETIVQTFIIPFKKVDISKVIVTYRNKDHDVFHVKPITSDTIRPNENDPNKSDVIAMLDEEETLLFQEFSSYTIQLNVLTGVSRFASHEIKGKTGPQHIQEVILR